MAMSTSARSSRTGDLGPLGRAIRECYEGVGMTQVQVADKTGLTQSQVSRYANGAERPNLDTIVSLEVACGRPRGGILVRAGYVSPATTVPEAILADTSLSHEAQLVLLAGYRSLVGGE